VADGTQEIIVFLGGKAKKVIDVGVFVLEEQPKRPILLADLTVMASFIAKIDTVRT
jgi:hypothetical protein